MQSSSDKAYEIITNKMKGIHDKRLTHIYGVAEMAEFLAKKMGVDPIKARIAGLMHDYSKYDDFKEAYKYLSKEDIEECEKYPFLYHAYLSAYWYKQLIGDDIDIFNAIRYHVFGRKNMSPLEEIIMISDYTEKNRTYENCIECRKILLDGKFNLAIYKSLMYTIDVVLKNNEVPHPSQVEVFNIYKEKVENEMIDKVIDALKKVRCEDIIVYDMKERSPFYDTMIVASVSSERQASSFIGYLEDLESSGLNIRKVEGLNSSWVLVDCNSIVVSVFTKEERNHFEIEKLYMDIPSKLIED